MQSTKKKFIITTITAGLAAVINYLISLILTSYISESLGTEAYGFVGLAKSVSGYTVLFTTCLNAFAARYITLSYHDGRIEESKMYFSSLYYANLILSIVLFIVSGIFILFLEKLISIPTGMIIEVKILFLLDFIYYFILAIGSVYSNYSYILNRLDITNIAKLLSYIIEAFFLFIFFSCFTPNLTYVGFALCLSSVFILVFNRRKNKYFLPEFKIQSKYFSFKAIKDFISSGIWNSLNQLGNVLNIGLDLLVANLMLSALAMGNIAIIKTFSTIFATLFQIIAMPFQPLLLKAYAENNEKKVVHLFSQSIKLSSLFSNILFAVLVAYGLPFLTLWLPNQDGKMLYLLLLITIIGHLIEGMAYPLFYTYTLTLKNKVPCIMTIIGGLLNVIGMVVMIKVFHQGVYSIVLTTTILAWLMHFVFTPLYTAHCLKVNLFSFYPIITKSLISAVICTVTFVLVSKVIVASSWVSLIGSILIVSIIGVFIHLIITSGGKQEIKEILSILIKK